MRAPDRRGFLHGLAALPFAAAPVAGAVAAEPADPFPAYHRKILDLQTSIAATEDDAEAAPMMDRWGEIDSLARRTRPTTLAGAIACLEYARREHVQFNMNDDERDNDPTSSLLLSLLDGALGVLRTIARGTGGHDV